jgi:fimbrial chaperone protein
MKRISIFLTVLLLLFSLQNAVAFQFTPITKDFSSSGPGTNQTFRVINTTEKRIAVQIDVFSREMDNHGNETLADASNMFYVYPRQVSVSPGAYQTVRVQWRGPAQTDKELPFRIIAEQLPLDFTQRGAGSSINILLIYNGTMYVLPEEINYDLHLLSIQQFETDKGEKRLALEFENRGNVHQLFYEPIITIISRTDAGAIISEVVLDSEHLKTIQGQNILAGKKRVFELPWPEGLKKGKLEAKFQLDPKR